MQEEYFHTRAQEKSTRSELKLSNNEYFHTAKQEWDEEKKKKRRTIRKETNRNILKTALKKETLIIILIGIIYLTTLQDAPIKKINETMEGDYARIKGEIIKCVNTEHLTIINLTDTTGDIKTIFFGNQECNKGPAEITGRLNTYKGEKELIGAKIKSLN